MAGGLIQIVTYGMQDIYLTGSPQITFFKSVYRRHTNFSIEAISQTFDGTVDFGETLNCTFKKHGDLLYRTYLNVVLPEVHIEKENFVEPINTCLELNYEDYLTILNTIDIFMAINFEAYRQAMTTAYNPYPNSEADALTAGQSMVSLIESIFATADTMGTIQNDYKNLFIDPEYKDIYGNYTYENTSINYATSIVPLTSQTQDYIKSIMDSCVKNSNELHKMIYYLIVDCQKSSALLKSKYANFAWVSKIGHAIVEYVDFLIGGHKIDRHTGDWLNIWYQLSKINQHITNYDYMIGNVPELTTFDNNIKPEYALYIPINFYYCKHNGLAFPIISLQHQDVQMNLRLKKLQECAYVSQDTTLFGKVHLKDLSIIVDYVYLDMDERRRFAQATHEYLIEQLQINDFNIKGNDTIRAELSLFHPCKELIWVFQYNDFITNTSENSICRWDNFSLSTAGSGNPIKTAKLLLNNRDRVPKLDGSYYNYVIPYEVHTSTPSDGINVLSFALRPEDFQPSSSCNMSKIDKVVLEVEFDPDVTLNANGGKLKVFAINYNILRFAGGMAGEAFYP